MHIMEIMNIVADAAQVPLKSLTLVGTRRYGPGAPVRFTEDASPVMGPSDVDVVVPWDGDMKEMRSRLEAAFPATEDHPNRGLVPYEGPLGWEPTDLNLVISHEGVTINLIVKNSASCAAWRAAAEALDKLSIQEGGQPPTRTALWADKNTRVAAFKAARNEYLHGRAKAQSEASASYWALHARAISAENTVGDLQAEIEAARRSMASLSAKADKEAYDAHQREMMLEAQIKLRGWILVAAGVMLAGLVACLHCC